MKEKKLTLILIVKIFQGFPSRTVPAIVTEPCDDVHDNGNVINMEPNNNRSTLGSNSNLSNLDGSVQQDDSHLGWTTMTPQQIAMWIDKRSRFVFPIAFLTFNIFYWIFVLAI